MEEDADTVYFLISAPGIFRLQIALNGQVTPVIPGIQSLQEPRVYKVVRVKNDKDLFLSSKMFQGIGDGSVLAVEADRRGQECNTRVFEPEVAGVAIIEDD